MDEKHYNYAIWIKDEDIHKTMFLTRCLHYKFVVLPFGLTNAPKTLMCLMNIMLNRYLTKFLFVFIDDILMFSKN